MSMEIKNRHKARFDDWSRVYDKSILQRIVFNVSHDMFFSEINLSPGTKLKVLDIGCGTGKLSFRLYQLNNDLQIYGVDLSKEMIGKAKAKLRGEPIDFKVGDVEALPYESNTFDIVTCSHSFHHYPNQRKALSEMYRVLKNDGKAMIIDGTRDNLWGNIIFGIVEFVEKEVYHIYESELKNLLTEIGFNKITQRTFNPIAPLLFTVAHAEKARVDSAKESVAEIQTTS